MLNVADLKDFERGIKRIGYEEGILERYTRENLKASQDIIKKLGGNKGRKDANIRYDIFEEFLVLVNELTEFIKIERLGVLNIWQHKQFERELSHKISAVIKMMRAICRHKKGSARFEGKAIDVFKVYEGVILDMHRQAARVAEKKDIHDLNEVLFNQLIPPHVEIVSLLQAELTLLKKRKNRKENIFHWNNDLANSILSYLGVLVLYTREIINIHRRYIQYSSPQYAVEHHLIKEFCVRYFIMCGLKESRMDSFEFDVQTFKLYFIKRDPEVMKTWSEKLGVDVSNADTFDEREKPEKKPSNHYTQFFEFVKTLLAAKGAEKTTLNDYYGGLLRELKERTEEINSTLKPKPALRPSRCTTSNYRDSLSKYLFFNYANYVVIRESRIHPQKFTVVKDTSTLVCEVIPLLVYDKYKKETMYDTTSSVAEPHFLSVTQRLKLHKYDTAVEVSREVMTEMVERAGHEKNISKRNRENIIKVINELCDVIRRLQDTLIKRRKNSKVRLQYGKFISDPYLIYKVLTFLTPLAIAAETRAVVNKEDRFYRTGRNSGFLGSNNIAVHGFNDHIKFHTLLKRIEPFLKEKEIEMGFIFELQSILLYLFHDAATYDLQNILPYEDEEKYHLNNKKGHKLIGAYMLLHHRDLQKLFNLGETGFIDQNEFEKNMKQDLSLMASVIAEHDYGSLHFDLEHMNTYSPALVKYLVMISVSGIADNSAGIAFLDDNNNVEIDPWDEKGVDIFSVKNNGFILYEMFKNFSSDKEYYSKRDAAYYKENNDEYQELVAHFNAFIDQIPDDLSFEIGSRKYFAKRELIKVKKSIVLTEWLFVCYRLCVNVLYLGEGCTRDKLIAGLTNFLTFRQQKEAGLRESDLLNEWSATSIAGLLNSGMIVLPDNCYDGTTLTIEIHIDEEFMRLFGSILEKTPDKGLEVLHGRIRNFLKDYKELDASSSNGSFAFSSSSLHQTFMLHNTDKDKNILQSIGLKVIVKQKKGIILKCIQSKYSIRLVDELRASEKLKLESTDENESLILQEVKTREFASFVSKKGTRVLVVAGPRDLPSVKELKKYKPKTLIAADLSFELDCTKSKKGTNTLEYLKEMQDAGIALVKWIDHHDSRKVLPLWDQVSKDDRFLMLPRSKYPACPLAIHEPMNADLMLVHLDFDGIMSGIKLLHGDAIKKVYKTIEEDSVVADARPKDKDFSKMGKIIYGALKMNKELTKDNEIAYLILHWLHACCLRGQKLRKSRLFPLVEQIYQLYEICEKNANNVMEVANEYDGIMAVDFTLVDRRYRFDGTLPGKELAKKGIGLAVVREYPNAKDAVFTVYVDTERVSFDAEKVIGPHVKKHVPFKFNITSENIKEYQLPLNVKELCAILKDRMPRK